MGNQLSIGHPLDHQDERELTETLESNALLNSSLISPEGLKKLVKSARVVDLASKEVVFHKGNDISAIFMIRSGAIRVTDRNEDAGGVILAHGALLDAGSLDGAGKETEKRSKYITNAIVTNKQPAGVCMISMKAYRKAIAKRDKVRESAEYRSLSKSDLFHDLNHYDLMRLYANAELRQYAGGAFVIRRFSRQTGKLYMLVSGTLTVTDRKTHV